jgi:hypothetical protein
MRGENMACFLIMTERDFSQLTSSMQAGVSFLNYTGQGRIYIQVTGTYTVTPKVLAESIRRSFPKTDIADSPQQHHIFPLFGFRSSQYTPSSDYVPEIGKLRSEDYYNFWGSVGINPHEYTVPVDPKTHAKLSSDWNYIWQAWIDEHNGEVEQVDVRKFALNLLDHFGIGGTDILPYRTY